MSFITKSSLSSSKKMDSSLAAKTLACRAAAEEAEREFNRIGQRVAMANAGLNWAVNQLTLVKKAAKGIPYALAEVGNKSLEEARAEVLTAREKMGLEYEAWDKALDLYSDLWKIYLVACKEEATKESEEELDEMYAEAHESERYWDGAH